MRKMRGVCARIFRLLTRPATEEEDVTKVLKSIPARECGNLHFSEFRGESPLVGRYDLCFFGEMDFYFTG